jgi:hypothetical protein
MCQIWAILDSLTFDLVLPCHMHAWCAGWRPKVFSVADLRTTVTCGRSACYCGRYSLMLKYMFTSEALKHMYYRCHTRISATKKCLRRPEQDRRRNRSTARSLTVRRKCAHSCASAGKWYVCVLVSTCPYNSHTQVPEQRINIDDVLRRLHTIVRCCELSEQANATAAQSL